MSSNIYQFEEAVVWINGTAIAGQVNEIEMPEINWDPVDHETIAFTGTPQFASKLDALETTITWAGYSPELAAAAANPYATTNLQVRANIGEYRANGKVGDRLLRIDLTGRFMSNSIGTFSPGEMERESMMVIDFCREVWDGTEVMAVGVNPPILRVNGNDLLAGLRQNLGLGA